MKVWAKIMNGDKIVKDIVFEGDYTFEKDSFISMVQEICYKLEFFTPVILDAHVDKFAQFNRVKFLPRDFIDVEGITAFIIERFIEDKKKPKNYLY